MLTPYRPDAQLLQEICLPDSFIVFHRFHLLVTSETTKVPYGTLCYALVVDFYFRINISLAAAPCSSRVSQRKELVT